MHGIGTSEILESVSSRMSSGLLRPAAANSTSILGSVALNSTVCRCSGNSPISCFSWSASPISNNLPHTPIRLQIQA